MKYIGFIISAIVGIVIGVSLTISSTSPRPPSTIQINIINKSEMHVSNIVVTHEDGTVSLNSLKKGKSQVLPVLIFGESSYRVEATLANGNIVRGRASYVEPGYKLTEIITKEGIKNEFDSLH